jgi:homocysteine S-methyltransferase
MSALPGAGGYALRAARARADIVLKVNRAAAWRSWGALEARLERGELIALDGPTGTELAHRGVAEEAHWDGWPAQLGAAAAVRAVHAEYVRAGSNVVVANTYATNRHIMEHKGFHTAAGRMNTAVQSANTSAVALARDAADAAAPRPDGPILVAGSISNHLPSDAHWPSPERELKSYREQARALVYAGVDVIFIEMVQDAVHGDLAVRGAVEAGVPVVVGLTLDVAGGANGDRAVVLRGEPTTRVEDAIATWSEHENIVGFSAMHCAAGEIEPMLAAMRAAYGGFIGAYPSQGEWDPASSKWIVDPAVAITPEEFVQHARMWYAMGANAVGGSSGFAPHHIVGVSSFVAQYNRVVRDGPRITRPVRRRDSGLSARRRLLPRSAGPTGDVAAVDSLRRSAGPTGDIGLTESR